MGEGVSVDRATRSAPAIAYSALLGPLTTVFLFIIWSSLRGPLDNVVDQSGSALSFDLVSSLTTILTLPVFLVPASLFAWAGLAVFGFPAVRLFKPWLTKWWSLPLVLIWAGLSGAVLLIGLMCLAGRGWPEVFDVWSIGAAFGAPTGFWFWLFYRRVLLARAALANEA